MYNCRLWNVSLCILTTLCKCGVPSQLDYHRKNRRKFFVLRCGLKATTSLTVTQFTESFRESDLARISFHSYTLNDVNLHFRPGCDAIDWLCLSGCVVKSCSNQACAESTNSTYIYIYIYTCMCI